VVELFTGMGEVIGQLVTNLKGIELPAAMIIFMLLAWILRQSKDSAAPQLASSSMTMATTLITDNSEKNDMILELMREQSDMKVKFVTMQSQMHQVEQRLEEAENARRKLSDEIVILRQRVLELTSEVEAEHAQKVELLKSIADLQRQLDQKDQEIAMLRSQIAALEAKDVVVVEGD
jgi:chromosome segregation ATPase